MSFNQYRTNPSQAVGSFKGRSETPKAWPSTAVGNWTNGELMSSGYVLEDSYNLLSRSGGFGALMNITNIPQTYRHLMLDFTVSQMSSYWAGTWPIVFNNSVGQQAFPTPGFDGTKGRYWYKGWSMGNGQNNTGARSTAAQAMGAYSNWSNSSTLWIYNYSDANQSLKPYKFWSSTNSGATSSYAGFMEGFGYLLANTVTTGGAPSPAITGITSYNQYPNGSPSYQKFALYGFGGLV